jgi:hypothetical protein
LDCVTFHNPRIRLHESSCVLAKIKTLNESVNRANQIILGYIVLKCRWEQTALAPINPLHEAWHPALPIADSRTES